MTLEAWLFFMAVWIAASIPLGPNALNCISVSAAHGFTKSLWSVLGVFIAANIHMALALTGLAAFMAANPVVFEILRWLGVGYLAWMGISLLRAKGDLRVGLSAADDSKWQLIQRAILISMSNPKAIFAWLAVFSQFIDTQTPLAPQLTVLAPSALSVTITVYVGYAALGRSVNRLFAGRRKRWFDRLTGSAYLAFAMILASADLRKA